MRLEVKLTKVRGPIGKGTAKAVVEDKTVAEGELTFALSSATENTGEKQG
jgi:3-hydroxyacyl-[acyl-carrier-protein] dehydratase